MPIDPNRLSALLDQDGTERARAATVSAPDVAPDAMASALALSRRTGAPAQAVAADPAPFEADAHLADVDRTVAGRPSLSAWLAADPAHPALARDELPAIAALHDAVAPTQRRTWLGAAAASLFGQRGGEIFDTLAEHFVPASVGAFTQPGQVVTDTANQAQQAALAPLQMLAGIAARDAARRGDTAEQARLRGIAGAYADPLGLQGASERLAGVNREVAGETARLGAQHPAPASLGDALAHPTDALAHYAGAFSDSLPAMLLAMATRNPEAAMAAIGGTTGAQTYTADLNGDGDTAPTSRLAALVDATAQGGLEAAGEMLPLAEAFRPGTRRFLVTPFAEGASEAVTQVAQTNAQDALHGTSTPVAQQIAQALDAFVVGHGMGLTMATLGGGHGDEAPSNAIPTRWFQAARAQVDRDYLGKVMQAAKAAKLRTRAPGAFEDLLQRQVGDTVVHVPVEQLGALFQSERVPDPAAAVQTLTGDANAWAEAQATGGTIAIPLARYATYLADAHATLAPHVALTADTALAAEDAKAAGVPTPEQFQADLAKALEAAQRSSERDSGAAGAVYDHFYGQLLGATDEVNANHIAATMQALYSTWGERLGVDPATLLQRFQINLNRPGQTDTRGAARDVDLGLDPLIDAALAGSTFTDSELRGPSLIPAIIAAGGINPDSVGGADLKAGDALKRPGLLSLTGKTTEAMAEEFSTDPDWAAHFTTRDEFGRADYREFLELIRQELGGSPLHAIPADHTSADRIATREAFRRDTEAVAAAIRAHADAAGTTPDKLDRATLRQIASDALSGEDAIVQRDRDPTDSPAFRAWFGDSKVVDAEGRPLLVYHTGSFDPASGEKLRRPVFFTADRAASETYRDEDAGRIHTTAAFLRIARPATDQDVTQAALEIKRADPRAFPYSEDELAEIVPAFELIDPEVQAAAPEVIDLLAARGFDGAKVRDLHATSHREMATWVVFHPGDQVRDVGSGALHQGALASTGEQSETYAHEEQTLNARLADWADALHLGSGGPRAVAVRPEDIGAVDRRADHGGAVEQGDASRADIAEQSQRLIEHAKAGGFFWDADSPILFALQHLPSAGGAEHQVFMVGNGDDRLIIRATDNGYFGPRADISPAQYLGRLEDYSRTFPDLQTRLIGVSESPDVAGHAVIWTVQRFVRGQRLATQSLLVEAFAKQGWEAVGDPYSYEFRHTATGATIADAHTDNVYQGENGALYPFDVVVTHLPTKAARLVVGEDALRAEARSMSATAFLQRHVAELMPFHTATSLPQQSIAHGVVDPAAMDPSELDDWQPEAHHQRALPDIAARQRAGEDLGLALVRGLASDPRYRQQVIDGHHRTLASLETGARVPYALDLDTLAELWAAEHRGADARAIAQQFRETGQVADDAALHQDAAPPFYSQLLRAVEGHAQAAAPAAQWIGLLSNLPGIKKDELAYYNLVPWLQAQQGKVTRAAIADYLRANELQVVDVLKGEAPPAPDGTNLPYRPEQDETGMWNVRGPDGRFVYSPGQHWGWVGGPNTGRPAVPDQDQAERSAYDMSTGYLRTQGTLLANPGDDHIIDRIDARDVADFGLEPEQLGEWAIFDRPDPRDPTEGNNGKGEFLMALGRGSYAEAARQAAEFMGEQGIDARNLQAPAAPYANMTLPGGTDYRVLLLQLPPRAEPMEPEDTTGWTVERVSDQTAHVRAPNGDLIRTIYARNTDATDAQVVALAAKLRREEAQTTASQDKTFTGGHWQEPNVVAHVRFDTRTDADGAKVLFVQEIQSDWHQAGRKRGYAGVENATYPSNEAMASSLGWRLEPVSESMLAEYGLADRNPADYVRVTYPDGSRMLYGAGADGIEQALKHEWRHQQIARFYNGKGSMSDAEWEALTRLVPLLERDDTAGVPDAPFKTTWPELVVKRMLRYAAERGFDKVAFPTPAQVPTIEHWGSTLEQIKADPAAAKRFGAILARYETEVPRLLQRLAKQLGGEFGPARINFAGAAEGLAPAPKFEPFTEAMHETFAGAEEFPNGDQPRFTMTSLRIDGEERSDIAIVLDANGIGVMGVDSDINEFIPWDALGNTPEDAAEADATFTGAWEIKPGQEDEVGLWDALPPNVEAPQRGVEAVPALTLTPAARETILAGLPMFQRGQATGPRGQIVGRDEQSIVGQAPDASGARQFNITVFEHADLSTFLHEGAHAFLEMFADLAADPNAPQQLRDDWAKTLAYLGVADRSQIGRDQHETWARSFEAYAREGKAPSSALRRAFAAFRTWLTHLYRSAAALNVTLTDEVRGVFDRMLATDAEIAQARTGAYLQPLITDAVELGMSPEQHEAYQRAVQAALERAEADLTADVLRAQQQAQAAWWREERRKVRATVEAQTRQLPVYRALRWLRQGLLPDGSPAPRPLKLDKAALVDLYGKTFPAKKLTGLYAVEGGYHHDFVAGVLGYPSGTALLEALTTAPRLAEVVEADTDRIMRERHPDPMTDGSLPARAAAAVESDHQAKLMVLELRAIEAKAKTPGPPTALEVMRAVARQLIGTKRAGEVAPHVYRAAEAKAGREAFAAAAKGDWAAAGDARRRQLLNLLLAQEATRVQREVQSAGTFLRNWTKPKRRAALGKAGADYLAQVDGLLERFDFKVRGKAASRRERLATWIDQQASSGIEVQLPAELVDEAFRKPFVQLTVDEVRALRDAVKHLTHLAQVKNRLLTHRGQVEWTAARQLLIDRLEQQPGRAPAGLTAADRSALQALADLGRDAGNWVLQPETILEWLDGGTTGPFHDLLWTPSEEAEATRAALQRQVGALLQAAFDALPKGERALLDRKHAIASLDGVEVSGHTILSAALNMGNAGNRDKLLRGGRVVGDAVVPFTPEQLAEMFSHLTAGHAQLVQGIWDAVNSLWPQIVAMEKAVNGLAPEKVEATAVTLVTRDGPVHLRGGYFPVMYDPRGTRAGKTAEDEQAKRLLAGQGPIRATTPKGHIEARTEFAAPVLLDYHQVLSRHLDGVMADIAYRQFLRQMYRILDDADVRRRIENRVGASGQRALRAGFERGAVGSFSLAGPLWGPFQGLADATMTNVSAAALGLRVPLAVGNIVTAPILAGARLPPAAIARGFAAYYANPWAATRQIQALSPMMVKRAQARSVELSSILANLRGTHGARRQMIEFTMAIHQWIVPLAENAIWLAAYQHHQRAGADTGEAVRQADKVIRQTQTKHQAKDLSTVEGNPYLRVAMQFAGPLVIINNRLQEAGLRGRFRGAVHTPVDALAAWIAMAAGGSWLYELIMGRGPDDDDDDGVIGVGEWAWWCARKLALLPFAAYPVLRDVVSALDGGGTVRPSPLVDAANALVQFGKQSAKAGDALLHGEPVDTAHLGGAALKATGPVTGLPTNQLVKTGRYLMEVGTGQHTADNPAAEAYYFWQGPPKQ